MTGKPRDRAVPHPDRVSWVIPYEAATRHDFVDAAVFGRYELFRLGIWSFTLDSPWRAHGSSRLSCCSESLISMALSVRIVELLRVL